jgi:recombinational DNA repair protein RecT
MNCEYVYAEIVGSFVVAIVQQIDPHGETGYAYVILNRDRDPSSDEVFYRSKKAALKAAQAKLAIEQSWYAGLMRFWQVNQCPTIC